MLLIKKTERQLCCLLLSAELVLLILTGCPTSLPNYNSPIFTTDLPATSSININTELSLTVATSDADVDDTVTYEWQETSDAGLTFSTVSGHTEKTYIFKKEAAGTYKVKVVATDTHALSTSSTVCTVTVTTPTQLMGGAIQGHPLSLSTVVSTLAGTAGNYGSSDGSGAAASFYRPVGLTTDGTNLYVAEHGNNIIRKVVISTGVVTTLAGTAGYSGSDDATGSAARFSYPYSITTDGTNLYVADTLNCTIRKIVIASGVVTTLAGIAGSSGSADGTGSAASFSTPGGITTDGTNLYVADSNNNTIRKIVIASGVVTTLAGTAGSSGFNDGTGSAARFDCPFGITIDGINLYVGEYNNNTIRKIVIASGVVTTLAGTAGSSGSVDGIGSTARFNAPLCLTTDGINLYVADTGNNTVRKIGIASGVVTTLAGTAGSSGSADGTGTAARFNQPAGITTDGNVLCLGEFVNYTIRMIQ